MPGHRRGAILLSIGVVLDGGCHDWERLSAGVGVRDAVERPRADSEISHLIPLPDAEPGDGVLAVVVFPGNAVRPNAVASEWTLVADLVHNPEAGFVFRSQAYWKRAEDGPQDFLSLEFSNAVALSGCALSLTNVPPDLVPSSLQLPVSAADGQLQIPSVEVGVSGSRRLIAVSNQNSSAVDWASSVPERLDIGTIAIFDDAVDAGRSDPAMIEGPAPAEATIFVLIVPPAS